MITADQSSLNAGGCRVWLSSQPTLWPWSLRAWCTACSKWVLPEPVPPTVTLAVRRQSGANTVAVIEGVKAKLGPLQEQLPPDVKLIVLAD